MVDKKYYRTGAEILLIIGLMISMGINVVDTDEGYLPYTCEKENIDDMMCYKLSRIGTTEVNRNCYYNRDSPAKYRVCSTGWYRLLNVDDYEIKCPEKECLDPTIVNIIAYTDDGKYFCNGIGVDAICVKDNTLEMPFG